MDALWQDVRYALRTLARSPGFTATGVIVLALAIAVNTAIFSLVNALIFVPLPVPNASELRFIYPFDPNTAENRIALPAMYREFEALRQADPALESLAAYSTNVISVVRNGELKQLQGELVTPNYFDVLGIRPQIGRALEARDDAPGAPLAAVISDDLWRSTFSADPGILGRTLDFDLLGARRSGVTRSYTIVGVAPPGFRGIANRFQPTEYWMPRAPRVLDYEQGRLYENPNYQRTPDPIGSSFVQMFFRKPAGVTDAQISATVATMARRFAGERRPEQHAWTLQVHASKRNRLPFDSTGRIVPERLAAGLIATASAVVLIALANLAGLLSARSLTRRAEMAVRTTLGAGAWRLSRQLLIESTLLALAGGLLGLAIARALVALLVASVPRFVAGGWLSPLLIDVPLDWRVLAFTLATGVVAAIVVSIAPVRQALARDLLHGLSDGQSSATGRSRSRLRGLILLPQVCASLVLLVVAALLVRAMLKEELADTGYRADDVVMVDFQLEPMFYYRLTPAERKEALVRHDAARTRLLTYLRDVPGAASVALTVGGASGLPVAAGGPSLIDRETFGRNPVYHGTLSMHVSAGYVETLRIPIKYGRAFGPQDTTESSRVAMVSEGLAWRVWGSPNAVGREIALTFKDSNYPIEWREVIGVVADLSLPLTEGAATSIAYLPIEQRGMAATTILARGHGTPAALVDGLKTAVLKADPKAYVARPRMMSDSVDAMLFPRRAAAAVLGASGFAGLLLACIGLYGVVSYSVAQRVREIGIRAALGAERRDIMRMILRDGARVIALGSAIGGILAFAAIKLTSAKVVALPQTDLLTLAVAPLVLALAMLAATYIPARRAASVDPMVALRRL